MTTAQLTNITREGLQISFFVQYSNGEERNYRFPADTFVQNELVMAVKNDIRQFDSVDVVLLNISKLKGKVYKLVGDNLVEIK